MMLATRVQNYCQGLAILVVQKFKVDKQGLDLAAG